MVCVLMLLCGGGGWCGAWCGAWCLCERRGERREESRYPQPNFSMIYHEVLFLKYLRNSWSEFSTGCNNVTFLSKHCIQLQLFCIKRGLKVGLSSSRHSCRRITCSNQLSDTSTVSMQSSYFYNISTPAVLQFAYT